MKPVPLDGLPGEPKNPQGLLRDESPMPADDPRLAAARRISRGLQADRDRALGIDTSKPRRPLVDSLPGLQAQLAMRHDLPMRVVADLLDEVEPMLALLARVRGVVDAAKDGSAMAWLDGFAEIRDTLYPDTEVARRLNERRAMTPAERAAERETATVAEREAWAGVSAEPTPADVDDAPVCDACDMPLARVSGPGELWNCVRCDPPPQRGLLRDPLRPCAECGRLTAHELCSQCADPDECGRV